MFGNSKLSGERFQKSILIILFIFLTFALIITWMTPATGYEASIYSSTPLVLWIAIISGEFVGISLIVLSLSRHDFARTRLWKFGLIFIVLGYVAMLGLFIIRGYFAWGLTGDPATHIGWANEILRTGHFYSQLIYPAVHIFMAEISMLTSLTPLSLHKIIPVFFALICVFFTYLFVRTLSADPVTQIMAFVIFCFPFVFSEYSNLVPNDHANMFLPFAFFLIMKYLKGKDAGWGILLSIILILYPVFHPLPAIVLGIVLLTLWIAHAFRDVVSGFLEKKYDIATRIRRNINGKVAIPFLVLIIWFLFWYSSFSLWGTTLGDMINTITAEGRGPSDLAGLTSQIEYAQGYGYNVVEIFLKTWGGPFLVGVFSLLAFPMLWEKTSREPKKENIFSLYGPWAVFCCIIPALYLFHLSFGPLRFLSYVSILGTIIVAYLVAYLIVSCRNIEKRSISLLISSVVILLLFILFICGLGAVYPSPYTYAQNFQDTRSEVFGMTNFFEHRNVSVVPTTTTITFFRFEDLLMTPKEKLSQKLPDFADEPPPPWHYGYDKYPSIAYSFKGETDLVLVKRDMTLYTDYYPEMAKYRFTTDDFRHVRNDPGANLVYSNGEYDLLTIRGKGVVV